MNNKSQVFPNCTKLKRKLLLMKKRIKTVEGEQISDKFKDKKLQILQEKFNMCIESLHEKLSLNSPHEVIDPLCSFEEIQK